MEKKEKKQIEVMLKHILYFIEDPKEQNRVIEILENCESKMGDSRFKNNFDKIIKKFKNNYFDLIDHLVSDILSSNIHNEEKKIIYEMLEDLKPTIEKGERTFLEKLRDLFTWS